MKAAEEWATEIARIECLTDADIVLIYVKQIQLEAAKAGMRLAAKNVNNIHVSSQRPQETDLGYWLRVADTVAGEVDLIAETLTIEQLKDL